MFESHLKILEALGIDPDNTVAVNIRLSVYDLPVVVVTQRLFDKDSGALADVLRTFTLYEQVEDATG
jgi:hypothetical protein